MTTINADPQQINIDAAIVVAPEESAPVQMEELLVTEVSSTSHTTLGPTDETTAMATVMVVVENSVHDESFNRADRSAEGEKSVTESVSELNVTPGAISALHGSVSDDGHVTPSCAVEVESTTTASTAEPASPFRGQCKYKSGKCNNERAKKRNGQAHTLCDYHRIRQNAHQRKSDRKHRESVGASAAAVAAAAAGMTSGELIPEETLTLVTSEASTGTVKKSKKRSYAKTTGGGQKEKELAALHSLSSMQYQQQQKEAEEMVKKQRLVEMMNDENTDHNSPTVNPDDPDSNAVSTTASMEQLLGPTSVAALMMKDTTPEVVSSTDPETFKNMVIDI